jgi:hypothetical protein
MIAIERHARPFDLVSEGDRRMHAAAVEVLAKSHYGALRSVCCRVASGVVELSGTVPNFYLKQLAQEAMLRLEPGSVRNLIEVRGDARPA